MEKEKLFQHVVFMGLLYDPKNEKDANVINNFFKEKDWGTLTHITQFKTLPVQGGSTARTDVIFKWNGTIEQLGRFAVQRFCFGDNPPRWLEDYIRNYNSIIPVNILPELIYLSNNKPITDSEKENIGLK